MVIKTIPAAVNAICKGMATFISFFTPEIEVYVDEPVKFIAKKEESPEMIRNHDVISTKLFPNR